MASKGEAWLSLLASDPRPALLASDEPFARFVALTAVLGRAEDDAEVRFARVMLRHNSIRRDRPQAEPGDRAFWVALSRLWQSWRSPLAFVKPAPVIDWHRRGFRRYWRWRSRKPGRPRIPAEHIAWCTSS